MDGMKKSIITVSELIALLQTMPQDAMVQHEGCDCYGLANGVRMAKGDDDEPEFVLITRSN